MRVRILFTCILLLAIIQANAQLMPLMDQTRVNGLPINPAYAGIHDALSLDLHGRYQWTGFEGSPRSLMLSMHSPLKNNRINLGLVVSSEKIGSLQESGVMLNYAYRVPLGKGRISMGLAAGFTSLTQNMASVRTTQQGDQVLEGDFGTSVVPEFSLGILYQKGRFYSGLSMPLFLTHNYLQETGKYTAGFSASTANYVFTTGYLFRLSEEVDLLTALLARSNPKNQSQLDLKGSVIFRDMISLGAIVRTSGNITAVTQVQATPQLRIGYAFGFETSELKKYQNGSHELLLVYRFKYIIDAAGPKFYME